MTPAPFRFRLERVRSLRERAEERAREELAAGIGHRLRGEAVLRRAADAATQARTDARGTLDRGATAADLRAAQAWVERAERDRLTAALDLDRRDAEVRARRTALAHAAREKEVLVRLEGRHRARHAAAAARTEQARLDEVALSQHRRRGVAA